MPDLNVTFNLRAYVVISTSMSRKLYTIRPQKLKLLIKITRQLLAITTVDDFGLALFQGVITH